MVATLRCVATPTETPTGSSTNPLTRKLIGPVTIADLVCAAAMLGVWYFSPGLVDTILWVGFAYVVIAGFTRNRLEGKPIDWQAGAMIAIAIGIPVVVFGSLFLWMWLGGG